MSVAIAAPAALASTFVTSVIGVGVFAVLSAQAAGPIAPDWSLGVACGLGGLAGGYLGARMQRHVPDRMLSALLGALAVGLAVSYVMQVLS